MRISAYRALGGRSCIDDRNFQPPNSVAKVGGRFIVIERENDGFDLLMLEQHERGGIRAEDVDVGAGLQQ